MGYFKTIFRQIAGRIGDVSGSDFSGCFLNKTKKDGAPALLIYGFGKEDFIFNKGDVKEITILESGSVVGVSSQSVYVGSKYKVVFNNGKTAILNIPAANCKNIEEVLY